MIRPALSGDAQAMADLLNPWIAGSAITFALHPKTAADMVRLIDTAQAGGHAVFVWETGGAVQGVASYGRFRASDGYARSLEHSIYLEPQAIGRGVGRALLAAVEQHARQAGGHQMIAGVSAENAAGRAFHAACGYHLIATLPQVGHKFGRFHDLWLLAKFL